MTDDTGAVEATAPTSDYAATLWAEKPEAPSKLMAVLLILLVKLILAIPHIVAVSLIQGAAQSIAWLAWWVVLITGRMPPLFADLMVASLRWNWRAIAWLYGIADDYPPFAPEAEGYPADVDCMLIENPHRGLALARILIFPILIMLIPHFLVLFFLNILAMLVLMRLVAEADEPLSKLRTAYEPYSQSGEINMTVADTGAEIERVAGEYEAVDRLDGLTVDLGDRWFNLRPSNTEPVLRLNVEAPNRKEVERLVAEVRGYIQEVDRDGS